MAIPPLALRHTAPDRGQPGSVGRAQYVRIRHRRCGPQHPTLSAAEMVYAVAMKTIEHFESALGRKAPCDRCRQNQLSTFTLGGDDTVLGLTSNVFAPCRACLWTWTRLSATSSNTSLTARRITQRGEVRPQINRSI